MEIAIGTLAAALVGSLSFNAYLFWQTRTHKHRIKALEAQTKEPTYDCRELLADLTEGAGLVKITRISPIDVFIRRS